MIDDEVLALYERSVDDLHRYASRPALDVAPGVAEPHSPAAGRHVRRSADPVDTRGRQRARRLGGPTALPSITDRDGSVASIEARVSFC